MDKGDGQIVEIGLLRSLDWIEDYGAHVGGTVWLDMKEMEAEGSAEVLAIEPCPPLEEGEGRLVTGTFKHTFGAVYDLKLESESEPIGVTGSHPFWSVDRKAWISAIDLHIGETLETLEGTTVVESRSKWEHSEAVYNIEVEGDHCYRVGESGVLVHNVSDVCHIFPEDHFNGDYSSSGGPDYVATPGGRTQRVEARVCKLNTAKRKTLVRPRCWVDGLNTEGTRVSRCHLLGHEFGGENSVRNLVPCCMIDNRDMSDHAEAPTAQLITGCECADIRITVTYRGSRTDACPRRIVFTSKVRDENGICQTFSWTVDVPEDLSTCQIQGGT